MVGKVVIVGAGQAGAECAISLRQAGFDGEIDLFGDEGQLPYQRPPLSKDFLTGQTSAERLPLRSAQAYERASVRLHLDDSVARLDPSARTVVTAGGAGFGYDFCVLATGSEARRIDIPGADLDGVFALRRLSDAVALAEALQPGRRVVVIGAGYLGLEAAASARKQGCDVTVVEAGVQILARTASSLLAEAMAERHRANGVTLLLGASVMRITGSDRVTGLELGTGELLPADIVLIAVGGVPATQLAEAAGLRCANGIVVDAQCRSSDPSVFAIGDCAAWDQGAGPRRLESVQAAVQGAKQVAAVITGRAAPGARVPYFWSKQFDLNLQIAGAPAGLQTRDVLDGDPSIGEFAVFRYLGGDLIAVEAVNMPAKYIEAQRAIRIGT